MRVLVVLSFELPVVPEITSVLAAIDPPRLPYFSGEARIVPDPVASAVEAWLDETLEGGE